MPSKEMRKTTIGMRSRRRSPLRNEFEVSPQIFWAECSTRWLSAQHFRSIIQPNYQLHAHVEDALPQPHPRLELSLETLDTIVLLQELQALLDRANVEWRDNIQY